MDDKETRNEALVAFLSDEACKEKENPLEFVEEQAPNENAEDHLDDDDMFDLVL